MTTEPTKAALAVMDADMECVFALARKGLVKGSDDFNPMAEVFAAHRIAALEEAAKVAETAAVSGRNNILVHELRIASDMIAAIRNLKGQP